jgi:hypothetical protein
MELESDDWNCQVGGHVNELESCGINARRRSATDEPIPESYGRHASRRVTASDLGKRRVAMQ